MLAAIDHIDCSPGFSTLDLSMWALRVVVVSSISSTLGRLSCLPPVDGYLGLGIDLTLSGPTLIVRELWRAVIWLLLFSPFDEPSF